MSLLEELSSQAGERSGSANYAVAEKCLQNEQLVAEIIGGLADKNPLITADCCEVLTEIAKKQPALVKPYGNLLPPLLTHKNGRARWEAMHCLALIADLIPDVIASQAQAFEVLIQTDKSVIIRDYALDALGNYAKTGKNAATSVYPVLKKALGLWNGKHAGHALDGLANVVAVAPELTAEIALLARQYSEAEKGVVKKSARKLLKLCEK